MNLSIVIVNWNSAEYTISCVSSVIAQTRDLDFEIVVVDNASTDDSCRAIQERCPSLKLVRSPQNVGFARANNLGFQHSSGGLLLFLNPDTELQGPAINLMYEVLNSSSGVGILGCRLLNSDLTVQTSCIHRFPNILNQVADTEFLRRAFPRLELWGMRPLFDIHNERPVTVQAVSGACQMVRREVFEKAGLYSTDYFMYMEDLELCYKVRETGKKVCYLGSATIVHHGGQSSKKRGGEDFSGPMMKESVYKFLRMSRGPAYAEAYRFSMLLVSLFRCAVLALSLSMAAGSRDNASLRNSFAKWRKILRWTIGLEPWTRQPSTLTAELCASTKSE